jgi:ribosomal-protein-alanine N-acetyltransferase
MAANEVGTATLVMEALSRSNLPGAEALDRICFSSKALQVEFQDEMNRRHSRCLVALQHENVIGYLLYWMVAGEMQILNVAVHPGARRVGVGQKLLLRCIDQAIEEGAWLATLEVRKSNEAAIRLYTAQNFRVLGTRLDYYSEPKEDALLMVRAFDKEP